MDLILRPVTQRDARDSVLYEAFKSLADRHGFPTDFPSVRIESQAHRHL